MLVVAISGSGKACAEVVFEGTASVCPGSKASPTTTVRPITVHVSHPRLLGAKSRAGDRHRPGIQIDYLDFNRGGAAWSIGGLVDQVDTPAGRLGVSTWPAPGHGG